MSAGKRSSECPGRAQLFWRVARKTAVLTASRLQPWGRRESGWHGPCRSVVVLIREIKRVSLEARVDQGYCYAVAVSLVRNVQESSDVASADVMECRNRRYWIWHWRGRKISRGRQKKAIHVLDKFGWGNKGVSWRKKQLARQRRIEAA